MEWVLGWITLATLAGVISAAKKRGFWGYFLLGFLTGPIGIVMAIVAKPDQVAEEQAEIQRGNRVRCPHCAELIRNEARVCRFCGRDVASREVSVGGVVLREDWQ